MGAPNRRRNPIITPGKKSERKRNKRQKFQKEIISPINGLTAISEKVEQERKAMLISNGTTDASITLLFEPSSIFNTETDKIRNITLKNDNNLININATNFDIGIELEATINDRSRVLKGEKPKIFYKLPAELQENKEDILQADRQIEDGIIERSFKRENLEKRNAAIAQKEKVERLTQIELEKQLQIEKSIGKMKGGLWANLFNKLTAIIPVKNEKISKSHQETETFVEEEIEEKEIPVEEKILVEEETEIIHSETETFVEEDDYLTPIDSGEVILADLRITMRAEPSPTNYTINMLTNNHNLSTQNAKYLINQIVSPISICEILTEKQFNKFIQSLDKSNSGISEGGEIWTQVIQAIGLSSLTEKARVDIYNILSDEKNQNIISKRVVTIALLLNALPVNFKQWWAMDLFRLEVKEHYAKANKFFSGKKFSQEAIDEARMLICSYAIEKPKSIIREYNYAKQMSGNKHENKTEKWLKESLKDVQYITEKEIQTYPDKHYGNKYINQKITPDILLEIPIQLSENSQSIHWIDAKNHFVDPALSSDGNVQSICSQMNKYVRTYGPGLIVWGKHFSEEWNDATKGVVQHIKI